MRFRVFASVPCAVLAVAAPAKAQSVRFVPMGDLPGGRIGSSAGSLSADGTTVCGYAFGPDGTEAVLWSEADGYVRLGDLPGRIFESYGYDISPNGRYAVGQSSAANGVEGFFWSTETGMIGLGDLPGGSYGGYASGVTDHGVAIGGSFVDGNKTMAFRWTVDSGMQGLGYLPSNSFKTSAASDITPDGATIVGSSTSVNVEGTGFEAFVWTQATGMQPLGDLPGGRYESAAGSISPDGRFIVGSSDGHGPYSFEPFLWSQDQGMQSLLSNGFLYGAASDLSDDASVIVGYGLLGGIEEAMFWTRETGMVSIRQYLLEHGIDTEAMGFRLTSARAVSADGRTIVGIGGHSDPSAHPEGWIVTIPSPSITSILMFAPALMCDRRRSSRRAR